MGGMRALISAVLTSLSLLASVPVSALPSAQAPTPSGQQESPQTAAKPERNPDDGWFFYRDPREEEKKKTPPPKPAVPAAPADMSEKVGSAEWIQKNLPRIMMDAINNPKDREKVELYGYVQKLAMDKSEQFANTYIRVMSANPALDETISNPTSTFALRELDSKRDTERAAVLQEIAKTTGLWYFFRSDCPYCHRQNPLLDLLQQDSGISILPISLDHQPLQDGSYPNWVADSGQGQYLGVTSTPTLFMVHPSTGQLVSLAVGQRSLPDIERRIIEISRDQNWIDEATYQRAMKGMPQRFITDAFDPSSIDDPNDPKQLLDALRRAGMHGEAQQAAALDDLQKATGSNATPWKGSE